MDAVELQYALKLGLRRWTERNIAHPTDFLHSHVCRHPCMLPSLPSSQSCSSSISMMLSPALSIGSMSGDDELEDDLTQTTVPPYAQHQSTHDHDGGNTTSPRSPSFLPTIGPQSECYLTEEERWELRRKYLPTGTNGLVRKSPNSQTMFDTRLPWAHNLNHLCSFSVSLYPLVLSSIYRLSMYCLSPSSS